MFKNDQNTFFLKPDKIFHYHLMVIFVSLITSFSTSVSAAWYKASARPLLIVREAPDARSSKVGNIPYGKKVNVLEKTDKNDSSRGKQGNWVKIQWKDSYAYVFDVYLTPLKDTPQDTQPKVKEKVNPEEPIDTELKEVNKKTVSNPKKVDSDEKKIVVRPKENNKSATDVAEKTSSSDVPTDPALEKGAPVCRSQDSMSKVVGIARDKIASTRLPYDCKKLSKPKLLRNIYRHEGLIRVEIVTRGRIHQYWTSSDYIAN